MKIETSFLDSRTRIAPRWVSIMVFVSLAAMLGAAALPQAYAAVQIASIAMFLGFSVTGVVYNLRGRRAGRGVVNVSKEGVDFGTSKIARSDIVSAQYAPATRGRRESVRLLGKRDVELGWIEVKTGRGADRILTELGFAPEKTTASFYAMASFGWGPFAILAALLGAVGGWAGQQFFGVPQLAYLAILPIVLLSAYFLPARLYVGADGLLWKTRLDPTFFAWSDVARIEPAPRGIGVVLKAGQTVAIPIAQSRIQHEYQRVAQAALIARAHEALDAFNRGDVPDVTARVARLGRTKEDWLAHLADREGSFREAPLRDDDLWRVVESPGATATARAGAAAVLARDANEEDRARLRIAADVCAEPRLRVVLDKAAKGEDVGEALGEVEDVDDAKAMRA